MRFVSKYLWSAAGIVVFAIVLPARASNPLVVKTDRGKVQGKMSADGQARGRQQDHREGERRRQQPLCHQADARELELAEGEQ